jgi:hypothetical protein
MRETLVAHASGSLAVWLSGCACYISARLQQRSRGEMTGETFLADLLTLSIDFQKLH